VSAAGDPEVDASQGKRLRIKIYGDYESVEHAKTRTLVMVDDLVRLPHDASSLCGYNV
jgi:hypothetical protein